jgi:hypothetical protein
VNVYALPRQPNNEPWDGLGAGRTELSCRVAAEQVRARVRDALTVSTSGVVAGTADSFVGDAFEAAVAASCGVASSWLQMQFEGPDMFATSSWGRSIQTEDRWVAPVDRTNTGARTGWTYRCGSSGVFMDMDVVDSDIAFNDPVGHISIDIASAPPAVLCDGWAWAEGSGGLMGLLVRFEHDGVGQNCDGLGSPRFTDHTIPNVPTRATVPGTTMTGAVVGASSAEQGRAGATPRR